MECTKAAIAATSLPSRVMEQALALWLMKGIELSEVEYNGPSTEQLLALPEVRGIFDQILNSSSVDAFTVQIIESLTAQARLYDQTAATNLPKVGTFGFGTLFLLLNELSELEPSDAEKAAILGTIETPPEPVALWFSSDTVRLRRPRANFSDLAS